MTPAEDRVTAPGSARGDGAPVAAEHPTSLIDGEGIGAELLSAQAKRLILDRIVRGEYSPGTRIVEFRLARELGVSQSPVREALRELAAIGIVTILPRRGARVRTPTAKELSDVSVVRSEVDALAAELAAERITAERLHALEVLIGDMFDQLACENFAAVTEADVRFHHEIVEASDNHVLSRVFETLAPFARTFITLTLPRLDVRRVLCDHGPILEALRAREPQRAAAAARAHQMHVAELISTHLDG